MNYEQLEKQLKTAQEQEAATKKEYEKLEMNYERLEKELKTAKEQEAATREECQRLKKWLFLWPNKGIEICYAHVYFYRRMYPTILTEKNSKYTLTFQLF